LIYNVLIFNLGGLLMLCFGE